MPKFFKPIGMGYASALIAVTSFLSYGIGLIRDRVLAVNFGTSSATDTYNAAFLIPDLLFNLFIAGALTAAFLPVFSEYLVKNKQEAYKIANTILTAGSILIGLLSILMFIFAPQIIPWLFPTATAQMQIDIVHMSRFMLPSAILFAISNTLGNVLMSYKHFIAYSISPILYNFGIILGIIVFKDQLGIYSAATGVLLGAVLHAIIRIVDTFSTEYRYRPEIDFKHPAVRKILKLMGPKAISLTAWQVNLYIYAVVGIKMVEGGLAAFNFSRNIQSFAVSLFGIAFATAVFPYITTAASQKDFSSYTKDIQKTAQRILFFTIPAMFGLMILSDSIINVILSGGVFDQNSVSLTSTILFFFALSIPFESLIHILARSFYAIQNVITPTIINLFGMAIIGFSTIFIAPRYGIYWFSLSFAIANMIQVILLAIFLRKYLVGFKNREFVVSLLKTILAASLMVAIILITKPLGELMPLRLADTLRILIGAGSFFLIALLIKSEEVSSIHYIINRLFKKA